MTNNIGSEIGGSRNRENFVKSPKVCSTVPMERRQFEIFDDMGVEA
jgi:hypothetical protein